MITKFRGMNISSKDSKRLALFYRDVLGVKMLETDDNYDGVTFGNDDNQPVFGFGTKINGERQTQARLHLFSTAITMTKPMRN